MVVMFKSAKDERNTKVQHSNVSNVHISRVLLCDPCAFSILCREYGKEVQENTWKYRKGIRGSSRHMDVVKTSCDNLL